VELFESVPNFSEGRDRAVIEAIAHGTAPAHLLDTDADPDHHRVVISLAAFGASLVEGLVNAVGVARRIDLREHAGVHPRIGAADVVPIVPLGGTSLESCRELAHQVGARIWSELRIPVFFYGHGERTTLADIRAGRARPSLGGPEPHPTAGAVCVGARRPLVAFNVIVDGASVTEVRSLARSLRESAGGLRGVQALVFELSGGRLQLSMNLFRLEETPLEAVMAELNRSGMVIRSEEVVGLCPAVAASAAAAGRLLEAHLAAAVALTGARRCRGLGDEEHVALGRRLESEAASLAALGVGQEELLAGSERAAAIAPVLSAARVLDPELQAMTWVGALGLFRAVAPATREAHAKRSAALEQRLGTLADG
jgi:glutamate formiminotransferase